MEFHWVTIIYSSILIGYHFHLWNVIGWCWQSVFHRPLFDCLFQGNFIGWFFLCLFLLAIWQYHNHPIGSSEFNILIGYYGNVYYTELTGQQFTMRSYSFVIQFFFMLFILCLKVIRSYVPRFFLFYVSKVVKLCYCFGRFFVSCYFMLFYFSESMIIFS